MYIVGEKEYMHDLRLEQTAESRTIPANMQEATAKAVHDFREGESVSTFMWMSHVT